MRFFLDENFPKTALEVLCRFGHEAIDIRGTQNEGADDTTIFNLAQEQHAVFLELVSKLILQRDRAKRLWARPEVKRARRRTEVRREPFLPTMQSHELCSRSQPKGVLKPALTTDRDFFHTVPHLYKHHFGVVVIALRRPNRNNISSRLEWFLNHFGDTRLENRIFQLRDRTYLTYPA